MTDEVPPLAPRKPAAQLDEAAVDRAAEALFNHAVSQALASIDKADFEASELSRIFERLRSETDTGQVLIFASYLEDRFLSLMKLQMMHLKSKDAEDRMFSGNGPLASFGNRIMLSYQLGWISADLRSRLDVMRSVRNEFAHKAFKASLSDTPMVQKFKVIGGKVDHFIEVARQAVTEDGYCPLYSSEEITPALHNLCAMAMLAEDTFREMLIMPAAKQFNVPPGAMNVAYDKAPKLMRDLAMQLSAALIHILSRPGGTDFSR